ncbi:gamma-glutamylcyclotransferase family protein [Clostridium tarantellae]|nr:gamma-glutamylcyclotransferase family protein [Clostridium tarantellae]
MNAPKEERRIFVYGSLRTGFFNYNKYLKGYVLKEEPARIKGKLYHMPNKGYPALLDGEGYVYGEVFTIKNDEYTKVMESMDNMENYFNIGDSNNEYNRVAVKVELMNTNTFEVCYVYKYVVKNKKEFKTQSIYIPNGNWASYMTKFKKSS